VDFAYKTESKKLAINSEAGPQPNARVHREQKIFRLPIELITELKDQAYNRSKKSGIRITETELVEKALRAFFDK
jgi:hypothetical protein